MSAFHHIRSLPMSKALTMCGRAKQNVAVISIVTPGDPLPAFRETPTHWLVVEHADNTVMDGTTARRIADFCHQHEGQNCVMLVHCLMGVSRSPSVANAIAGHYQMEVWHMQSHVTPMSHVTAAVRSALAFKAPQ